MVWIFSQMSACRKLAILAALFATLLMLLSCVNGSSGKQSATPLTDDLDRDSLRTAVQYSIAYLQKIPPEQIVGEQPRVFTAGEILASLQEFDRLLDDWSCRPCFAREIERRFEFVPSSKDPVATEVLFTGYYQPVIDGSLVRTEKFRYPIYGRPTDLIIAEQVTVKPQMSVEKIIGRAEGEDFVPYYNRREIDQESRLEGRGLEIAWVADPIELFFLHIQGSGIIRLPDGTQLSVGYAGRNGWPYRSIGRLLIDSGKLTKDEMSMQRLRRYLRENPQEQNEIFNFNPSYIFFRMNAAGPMGSLEVPVTAERSLATDSRLFPKGALVLVSTEIPVVSGAGELTGWRAVRRYMLNQDTGGAIRGPQRADIYFGADETAASMAGYMNRPGRIFFPVLKANQSLPRTNG
ncbi:MAG TPA: MltA domain-containing protein [Candidatus Limnocylindrales bacterium]|nr:MltA domain-containing protein [Candidatus Limnocylindrales bacterium]